VAGGPGGVRIAEIHQTIFDAVAAGDVRAARAAVLRHHEVMLEHLGR
jgi:DNA-binding FadR family transcriptional regulator